MPIRTVRNETSLNLKRTARRELNESWLGSPEVENNANILGADVAAPNPIFYAGQDHFSAVLQYDLNAV